MSDVFGKYTMTKTHFMQNELLKMAHALYITEIYRLWQPNCSKLKMVFHQTFFLIFAREAVLL